MSFSAIIVGICGVFFVVTLLPLLYYTLLVYILNVPPITEETRKAFSCKVKPQEIADSMWHHSRAERHVAAAGAASKPATTSTKGSVL